MSKKTTSTSVQAPAIAETITITEQALKKYTRFTLPDGRVLCIAFPGKKSANTYFHHDFDQAFSKIDGAHNKSDIETHPDDYNLQMRVTVQSTETPTEAVKNLLVETIKNNSELFLAKTATFEAYVPKPKAPAKSEAPVADPNELETT